MRKIALLLILSMLLSTISSVALAADNTEGEYMRREDTVVTDKLYNEKISGNLYFSLNSPRVRFGSDVFLLDENNPEAKPVIIGGSLMLPAAFLAKVLEAELTIDDNDIILSADGIEMSFKQGSKDFLLNGEAMTLVDAPTKISDKVYLPMRAVFETFKKEVWWNDNGIVVVGDDAESLDWNDKTDFEILKRAVRDVIYETPTPDEVERLLKEKNPNNQHPRLLIRADEVAELRKNVQTKEPYKTWFEHLKKTADGYVAATMEELDIEYRLEANKTINTMCRKIAEYLQHLAFAYLATGDVKYADKTISIMMKLSGDDFPDWNPWHMLDIGDLCWAMAIGYDWCYDRLRPSQRWKIANAIVEKALKPVMEDYNEVPDRNRSWYWSSKESDAYPQNWVSVIFNGTGMAALAIGDEDLGDFKEIGEVIVGGIIRQQDLFDEFMPDGAYKEGIMYWSYTSRTVTTIMSGMDTALGTTFSLGTHPGFVKSLDWVQQMIGPDGGFNYGINKQNIYDSAEYLWFADKLSRPELTKHRLEIQHGEWGLSPTVLDMVWYKPLELGNSVPLDPVYESRGPVTMSIFRGASDDTDSYIGLFGSYMDKAVGTDEDFDGTFIMDMLGKRFALDLGADNAIYQTGIKRNDYYRARAEGHNTVIIEPGIKSDHDHDPYAVAKRERSESDADESLVVYDMTEQLAYKGAESWRRAARLNRDTNRIIVQDELSAKNAVEYYWFMHTKAEIEISEDGRSAVLTNGDRQIIAKLQSPDSSLKFTVMDAVPLPTSPNPSDNAVNTGVRKLTVHGLGKKEYNMAVEFIPLFGDDRDISFAKYVSIDDWALGSEASIDESLTLDTLKLDGVEIAGFAPNKRFYTIQMGVSNVAELPSIEGISNSGRVTYVAPTEDNYMGKIVVSDKTNPKRINEYYIEFLRKDFSKVEFTTPKIYSYGFEPEGLTELEVAEVNAEYIPNPKYRPEYMLDGDTSTIHSTYTLGTIIDFDLGSTQKLTHVGNSVYLGEKRGMMYTLAASNDKKHWTEIASIKTGGTTSNMEVYEIPETNARYLRMFCCSNTVDGLVDMGGFSISEMKFFTK